jgi:hypothetical protein
VRRVSLWRERPLFYPLLVLSVLLVVWLLWRPPSPDLAAQAYRAHLFEVQGFSLWDNNWYAGHYIPDYSLIFPALAYLLGLHGSGVLAVVLSTVIFRCIIAAHADSRVALATTLFALGAAGDLFIGRITFAFGVTIGLASVLALMRGHYVWSALLSLACAAASPVAGSFLLLAAGADVMTHRRVARAATLAVPAVTLTVVLVLLFPEGGYEPFALTSLLAAVAATLALSLLLAPEQRLLRHGAQLYMVALLLSYFLKTPMGSNVVRFGVLFAPATLAGCVRVTDVQRVVDRLRYRWRGVRHGHADPPLVGRTPAMWMIGVVGVLLVAWQINGPLAQSAEASANPASYYSFYVPVIRYLDRRSKGQPMRIETPFTRSHWDATFLGERFDLARGWERQLDTNYDALFYAARLTAQAYHAWLLENGVSFVALSDAPLDFSSVQEAAMIRRGLPFLHEVFQSRNWRVYAVIGARPLASGPGQLTAMDGDGFTLHAKHAGTFVVRVHYNPYWKLVSGVGSVTEGQGGWTRVTSNRTGEIAVDAEFSLGL